MDVDPPGERLIDAARQVAALHAARATDAARDLATIRASTSWRLTAPVRAVRHALLWLAPVAARARTVLRVLLAGGMGPALLALAQAGRTLRRGLARRRISRQRAVQLGADYATVGAYPPGAFQAPRVLIIAELAIAQCTRYRVLHRQAQLAQLGFQSTVAYWRDGERCRTLLQLHDLVIFYRVPGDSLGLSLIAEAKRLGVPSFWEVDDLIFDLPLYRGNRNLRALDGRTRRLLLRGVPHYRAAMLACDHTIASTASLADAMRAAGAAPALVIENALDPQAMQIAAARRALPAPRDDGVIRIVYGSGTRTHDADFACVAGALREILRTRTQVRLCIIGPLGLPPELQDLAHRIDRVSLCDYPAYLGHLGAADISIAPLEDTWFNAAKSNIKYLEASILGLPAVCPDLPSFRHIIAHGENGFLARTHADWLAALAALVDSAALRTRVGEAARRSVLATYAPALIARGQVAPLVAPLAARLASRPPARLRVLVVNVYFWPQAFGGATIVADAVARRLHARPDTDVVVLTSCALEDLPPYALRRYDSDGVPVLAVKLPSPTHPVLDFDNPDVARVFRDALHAVRPDVVHVHCVQGLGASILNACRDLRIPYVITLHDAWWLCARQFMVREDNRYCFQTRIDLAVCQRCTHFADHVAPRFALLQDGLRHAAALLAPSQSHRQLYLANGLPPDRVLVDRNGVRHPARPRGRRPEAGLRFGYTGGNIAIKGMHLVRQAFEALARPDATLVLVDNTINLGFASLDTADWRCAGHIEIVPAYAQADMDAFFDQIDVLLFPSQWRESFGLTVREALLRDVWVIVTDCGGAAEDVVDGVNGTIIPMLDDAAPLRAAMASLLDQPGRLREYVNPFKATIGGYDEQAAHVFEVLCEAAVTAPAPSRTAPVRSPPADAATRADPVRP